MYKQLEMNKGWLLLIININMYLTDLYFGFGGRCKVLSHLHYYLLPRGNCIPNKDSPPGQLPLQLYQL